MLCMLPSLPQRAGGGRRSEQSTPSDVWQTIPTSATHCVLEGAADGDGVGALVGDFVGAGVGAAVGEGLGALVGDFVGAGVGAAVGEGLGAFVG